MARPSKNNAEYFPHVTNMRNHRKVKVLRNRFGMVLGYAFWSLMLEWLAECDGLEWEDSELEIEMFASELGVSAAEIRDMVDLCVKLQLLSKTESGFIYSEALNENLQPVFDKRDRERDRSKNRKRQEDGTFSPTINQSDGVSAAEIPQIRVEYSKEDNKDIWDKPIPPEIKIPDDISPETKNVKVSISFKKPSCIEVSQFVIENYQLSEKAAIEFSEQFWSHYEANGWMVGKNKMKSWHSAISGTWKDTREKIKVKFPNSDIPKATRFYLKPKFTTDYEQ